MTPRTTGRRLPAWVEWELFDPIDHFVLMRAEIPTPTMREIRRVRRMIQRAPKRFRPMGRPDGRPIGLRSLRTLTRLVYGD